MPYPVARHMTAARPEGGGNDELDSKVRRVTRGL